MRMPFTMTPVAKGMEVGLNVDEDRIDQTLVNRIRYGFDVMEFEFPTQTTSVVVGHTASIT